MAGTTANNSMSDVTYMCSMYMHMCMYMYMSCVRMSHLIGEELRLSATCPGEFRQVDEHVLTRRHRILIGCQADLEVELLRYLMRLNAIKCD